ncbi:unnamed protein product [Macrosiphum euphorbiae]|uniref:Uncharacterized protein n=1 Tax=Macrosiphum euphorbiae TaxID=13131 RepID=A0AAV0VML4_9HEMI|nr:unnamed protein product [Macrosiphum euphorbiae]
MEYVVNSQPSEDLMHNHKTYKYDMENPYKNFLTSYELANLIDSEKDKGGKSLNLYMDDNVKCYFNVHAKQLKDNINKLKRFTIPELCKSKLSSKNQEETENVEQQVTEEENEASEVLA